MDFTYKFCYSNIYDKLHIKLHYVDKMCHKYIFKFIQFIAAKIIENISQLHISFSSETVITFLSRLQF